MAKRQYESKIALQTRNFIDVKDHTLEETSTTPAKEISDKKDALIEKPEEKKASTKDQKPAQTKIQSTSKVEEKEPPKVEAKVEEDAVTEKANAIIMSLIESGQIQVKKNGKSGRPKKYDDETISCSFRLTKTNYDYAHKMGRTKYASMTEYINHLIDADSNK